MAKKRTMKHLGSWQKFVMKVRSENPDMSFKEVLKLAGKLKKQGVDMETYPGKKDNQKPKKSMKKKNAVKKTNKRKMKKGKTMKKK